MAWIESHTVLRRHRKVLLTAHDLQIDPVYLVGHLTVFWHTVLEQQEDGDLTEWPCAMIEQAAGWTGEPGKFSATLRTRGWVDGHLVHDWLDYVGPYLTRKYSTGNPSLLREIWKKHGCKYGEGKGKYTKQKASNKRVECEQKVRLPLPLPNLNPSLPNPSEPKNKKKEEEEAGVSVDNLVSEWNAIPGVRVCRHAKGLIREKIARRIQENPTRAWWTSYLALVRDSDFLCGRKTDFRASLDWTMGPTNMAKILNGNYTNVVKADELKTCGWSREPCAEKVESGSGYCGLHREMYRKFREAKQEGVVAYS